MNFRASVEYLLSLGHETLAMKLGLRNTELLLKALDNPERSFQSVQIAGTNGKGSTAAMLDSICRAAGIKCGLYTSPHLVSITERIKISGTPISREDFAHCATRVRDVSIELLAAKQIEALPTFFEQVTAIALLAFRNARVELAILETGLGGRLDSTTAANASLVAITPIAMDHEEYLGSTLAAIASEKAAIIRPGVKAVIAKQSPEALAVLLQRCEATAVTPVIVEQPDIETATTDGRFVATFTSSQEMYKRVCLGLRGAHQVENAAVAIQLAELLRETGFTVSKQSIVTGLETATHDGRLELIPPFLIDGAHNPAGAESLRSYLDQFVSQPVTLIFGAMRDKQLEQIGELLFPRAELLILTLVDNPRTASLETLHSIAQRFGRAKVLKTDSSAAALQLALEQSPVNGLICIAGSLYLVGELRPQILNVHGKTL